VTVDACEELLEIVDSEAERAMASAMSATLHRGDRSGWRDVAALLRRGAELAEQIADGGRQ